MPRRNRDLVTIDEEMALIEHAWSQEWTDGLPVVPPTPGRVQDFLTYIGLEADEEIGRYDARNLAVAAGQIAANAVMAGCKREYLPVVIAAIEGVLDPAFRMNHLASTSSPWPVFIVNGPVIERIGLNNGAYVMGPGARANATIARAISLTLSNCLDARPGGVQQGVMGNPARTAGLVIGEEENSCWEPISAMHGFVKGTNTVTVMSTFEGSPQQILILPEQMPKMNIAESIASFITYYFSEGWCGGGAHLVLVPPVARQVFLNEGWTKSDLRRYLAENAKVSVGALKRRFRWGPEPGEEASVGSSAPIREGDEERFVYLGKDQATQGFPQRRGEREADFFIATSGSQIGHFHVSLFRSFPQGPDPVTKVVRNPVAM